MAPHHLAAPEGWIVSTVEKECSIDNQLRLPLSEDERKEMQGIYPYYGPTKAVDFIDHYRVEGRYALIGEDGDHFLKYASQDMTLLVEGQFNVNNHAHLVRGNGRCTTEWFYTYFRRQGLTPYLTRQGAGRYKLNKATLEGLPMLIPPVQEQIEIFRIISEWDSAIDLTDRLITEKRVLRKGLIQQLLTGKRRLFGFTGKWRTCKFSEFLTESRRQGSDGATARKLTVKLYAKGVLPKEEKTTGSESTQYYVRRKGQFIYSKLDFLNGAFGIIPDNLDGYESTLDLPAFDVLSGLNIKWLLYFVSREEFYSQQLGLANGGRKARRVNPKAFLSCKANIPEREEQDSIVAVLAFADRELELLQAKAAALREQKIGLMQQLLTGKKRVKV